MDGWIDGCKSTFRVGCSLYVCVYPHHNLINGVSMVVSAQLSKFDHHFSDFLRACQWTLLKPTLQHRFGAAIYTQQYGSFRVFPFAAQ